MSSKNNLRRVIRGICNNGFTIDPPQCNDGDRRHVYLTDGTMILATKSGEKGDIWMNEQYEPVRVLMWEKI